MCYLQSSSELVWILPDPFYLLLCRQKNILLISQLSGFFSNVLNRLVEIFSRRNKNCYTQYFQLYFSKNTAAFCLKESTDKCTPLPLQKAVWLCHLVGTVHSTSRAIQPHCCHLPVPKRCSKPFFFFLGLKTRGSGFKRKGKVKCFGHKTFLTSVKKGFSTTCCFSSLYIFQWRWGPPRTFTPVGY